MNKKVTDQSKEDIKKDTKKDYKVIALIRMGSLRESRGLKPQLMNLLSGSHWTDRNR